MYGTTRLRLPRAKSVCPSVCLLRLYLLVHSQRADVGGLPITLAVYFNVLHLNGHNAEKPHSSSRLTTPEPAM